MRLDKYLKVSRLVKRRTIAAELCGSNHVSLNGKVAKASSEVSVDDEIAIRFGSRLTRAKILIVPVHAVSAQQAETLYELLEESRLETI